MKRTSVIMAFVAMAVLVFTGCLQTGSSKRSSAVPASVSTDSSSAKISKFYIGSHKGVIDGDEISVVVACDEDLSSLEPTITYSGARIMPDSGEAQDFSYPVEYTVSGSDGSERRYTVTVSAADGDAKEITEFTLADVEGSVTTHPTVLTASSNPITVQLPAGTAVSSLTPEVVFNGASISPTTAKNFSTPQTYTVTACDGTKRYYRVSATVATSGTTGTTGTTATAPVISQFVVSGVNGVISQTTKTISLVNVPCWKNVDSVTPSISATGTVSPAATVAQDFRDVVSYTVTSTADSTVSVIYNVDPVPICDIGDTGPGGGLIFSIGSHNLEVSPDDFVDLRWSKQADGQLPYYTYGVVTSDAIGAGEENTGKITAVFGAMTNAAQKCESLVLGGKSDWYLPSSNELGLMYTALVVNQGLTSEFSNAYYWSSTEAGSCTTVGASCTNAVTKNMSNGQSYSNNKSYYTGMKVRCIRNFD